MYATLLALHLLGLVMGLGGAIGSRMTGDFGRENPNLKVFPLAQKFARLNAWGLVVLLVTGVWLTLKLQPDMTLLTFQIKLALVVLLVGLSGVIHMNLARFKRSGDSSLLAKNRPIQLVAMVTTVAIVGFATVTFY